MTGMTYEHMISILLHKYLRHICISRNLHISKCVQHVCTLYIYSDD